MDKWSEWQQCYKWFQELEITVIKYLYYLWGSIVSHETGLGLVINVYFNSWAITKKKYNWYDKRREIKNAQLKPECSRKRVEDKKETRAMNRKQSHLW